MRNGQPPALSGLKDNVGLIETLTGSTPDPVEEKPRRTRVRNEQNYRATYEVGKAAYEMAREVADAEDVTPSDVVRFAIECLHADWKADGALIQQLRARRIVPRIRMRVR